MTDFVLRSAQAAAERTIQERAMLFLTVEEPVRSSTRS